jgi:hypothetical protein
MKACMQCNYFFIFLRNKVVKRKLHNLLEHDTFNNPLGLPLPFLVFNYCLPYCSDYELFLQSSSYFRLLTLHTLYPRLGCALFAPFFYSLRSKSKRIWILFASYSHVSVYSQTPFIRIIRFIFASKYSHRFAYKYLI